MSLRRLNRLECPFDCICQDLGPIVVLCNTFNTSHRCETTVTQAFFISRNACAMAALKVSVDVKGQEFLDSIPNLTRPGAARSEGTQQGDM